MKKRLLLIVLVFMTVFPAFVMAEGEKLKFRVGMEAAYAPFNWTQQNDSNGAVPIEGAKGEYANGYDVQIAKLIAEGLDRELVIVKTEWDGLAPALTSGKIDAIIAGMSPTEERKKEIDFTENYYESNLVLVTKKDSKYSGAKSLEDFRGARVAGQLNTFHDRVIDQIPEVDHQPAFTDFSAMRVALESGKIDAYVSERPEGISASRANNKFSMVELEKGFEVSADDVAVAIGLKKNSDLREKINTVLSNFSPERRQKLMDDMVNIQLGGGGNIVSIFKDNLPMFISGLVNTVIISFIGTLIGLLIGMFVGIFKTLPSSRNAFVNFILSIFKGILNIYVQVFRGTPMIVQAMLFYYGLQQFFDINMSPMTSAFIVVSVNTGAYMAELVRGGINSIDRGQGEATYALGMNHFQSMIYVILPQAFKNILPSIGNEFIVNIKDTSVLNVISVQELFFTTKSIAGANFKYFETYAITSIIYLVMTLSIAGLLHLLERRLMGKENYEKLVKVSNVMKSSN